MSEKLPQKTGGLAGVVAGKTAISTVGKEGVGLTYRGYSIEDLAEQSTFEEVAYLLMNGHLPDRDELRRLSAPFGRYSLNRMNPGFQILDARRDVHGESPLCRPDALHGTLASDAVVGRDPGHDPPEPFRAIHLALGVEPIRVLVS